MTSRKQFALALTALAFVLFVNGALPFVANPDHAVSFWVAGFAQSIANQNLLGIHAIDVGYPKPAPMVFGLPQAYLTAVFIKLGIFPSDAYTMTVAVFLVVAFIGFQQLAARLGIEPVLATAGAVLWFSLPIIRAHEGFGPVITGIAMLPFYLATALAMLDAAPRKERRRFWCGPIYAATALLALFTDGYSFMMFASGATILLLYRLGVDRENRRWLIGYAVPVHGLAFSLAYAAYALYVGRASYEPFSLGVFRYFGAALGYLMVPTEGISWLLDQLGLSSTRTGATHFGDPTVWRVSFSAPLIAGALVLGALSAIRERRLEAPYRAGFILIALFGFYMALGPTLKGEPMVTEVPPGLPFWAPDFKMASYLFDTGSGWLSLHAPGFSAMRASYRWVGLGSLACVVLILLALRSMASRRLAMAAMVVLVLLFMPNLAKHFQDDRAGRQTFMNIDHAIEAEFGGVFSPGERAFFMPYDNDFLITYIAPRLGIRAYNIGGDKNLAIAQKGWPEYLARKLRDWNGLATTAVSAPLRMDDADVVVIPWFDGRLGIWSWPCPRVPACVEAAKKKGQAVVAELKGVPDLAVKEYPHFVTVRLSGATRAWSQDAVGLYPTDFVEGGDPRMSRMLISGWNMLEPNGIWSTSKAELNLTLTPECRERDCLAKLTFVVFGASARRPVQVNLISETIAGGSVSVSRRYTTEGPFTEDVRVARGAKSRRVVVEVPDAGTPRDILGIPGDRVLGVFLKRLDLKAESAGKLEH